MKILAIETSCDETAIAILECEEDEKSATFKILGNALLSQIELHRPYGGVYPSLAKREHLKNLPIILEQALTEANLSVADVDVVAVTAGPGLEPALWTGIEFAKNLATKFQKPLVAVNHMEGHIVSALARTPINTPPTGTRFNLVINEVEMPVLALLISGGHTELVLMREWLKYELIGQTVDDAVGEAFDKVARMLGLPYPGGPEISKLAEQERSSARIEELNRPSGPSTPRNGLDDALPGSAIKLPRPMIHSNTCDFSFAGLKTAVLYVLKEREKNTMIYHSETKLPEHEKMQIAHEFENAVGDVLWKKTAMALEQTEAKTLVIGGGVSANTHIRRVFKEKIAERNHRGDASMIVDLRIPTFDLTTDNAVMIALAGYYRASRGEFASDILANGNLSLA